MSGLVGLGMGYLTLRLRGAFFAIATLALAVVLQTLVVNWNFVGGSRGAYMIRPEKRAGSIGNYIQYLFLVMLALAVIAIAMARSIERSRAGLWLCRHPRRRAGGRGFGCADAAAQAHRHHAVGRPHGHGRRAVALLRRLSPSRLRPSSSEYAVNSIAMPMIGGTTAWLGPVIGAVLLGTLQQVATVTISSALNLLIVGVLLVGFVIVAPNGIVGLWQRIARRSGSAMSAASAEVDRLGKRFGGFVALDGIDLAVLPGERLGLIGPNGSGKSTLVNCICGTLATRPARCGSTAAISTGVGAHQRTRLGIARSFQLPRPFASMTVAENLRVPLLYTVNARRALPLDAPRSTARCAELLHAGRARRPRPAMPARPHPGRDAQARARPRHGGGAPAAHRGRGDGGPVASRGRRHRGAADQAERARRHHHPDRAHHARRDELFAAAGRAGLRPQDRRRRAPRRSSAIPTWRGPTLANSLAIAGVDAAYGAVRVLEDVSMTVAAGETVVLLGTNGNGKSTLMKCIMGIVPAVRRPHRRRDRRRSATT